MGDLPQVEKTFQILIRDDGGLPENLPPMLGARIQALRELHPEATHNLLDGRDVRSFMVSHFSSEVVEAYDSLAPYSYKCDLARLCLLLVHGGLYVDVGVLMVSRLEMPSHAKLVAFRADWRPHSSWSLSPAVIFSTPGRPELRVAIDLTVENCRNRYYGVTPIDPVGPIVFGRAVAICNNAFDYWLGEVRYRSVAEIPELGSWLGANQSGGYVFALANGKALAVGKPALGGDLKALGISGTNNYNDIWLARRVYGERKSVWPFSDSSIHTGPAGARKDDGIWLKRGVRGFAAFGPYASLPAGRYLATLIFDPGAKLGRTRLDVCTDIGARVLCVLDPGDYALDAQGRITIPFESSAQMHNLEVRMHADGDCEGRLLALEIVEAD